MLSYNAYQLKWLIDHEYSLKDLLRELQVYLSTDYLEIDLLTAFSDWERECGFNGEIYAGREEFYDNECCTEEEQK